MSTARRLGSPPGRAHLVIPARRDPLAQRGPTKAEAEGPGWRTTTRGRFVPIDVVASAEQRILEASMVLPDGGAITGWAAPHWRGQTRWFEGMAADGITALPVCLAVGTQDIRPQPGIVLSAERLDPADIETVDGLRVTTPVRSACFDMRYATDVRAAARLLSMAAYHDAVSVAEMTDYASLHPGWTGIPTCRGALDLAEENCWSPAELDMTLIWRLDAGLPRPLCNRPIFDEAGRHIGTPDLLDEEAGLVCEYDGALHLVGHRRARDIDREERFRRAGLEYLTVLGAHRGDPWRLIERMHAVRARSAWAAPSTRTWTTVLPRGWLPTHTVDLRRELSGRDRRTLLRYRSA